MSTVLNDRDAILQAATVRIVNPKNAWINLTASAPGFHLNSAGQVDLSKVTVTADLVGLDDAVTFTAVGGTLSNAAGRSVDVTYAGQAAIITAKVVSNGDEFQRALVIPVLRDGASGTGTPGARGAGHYYGSGTAWTDTLANITVPTTKVVGDVVTISSGTFAMEKRWTGSAWVETGVVIPGSLIVPGSILASALNVLGLTVRKPGGTVSFSIGEDGTALFGGSLAAASGTLGSLTLAAGGNVRSANSQGWGYWPPSGAGNVMYLGAEGFQLGNYNDGKFIHFFADGSMAMPGFSLANKQITLDKPVLLNPDIQQAELGMTGVPSSVNGGSGLPNDTAWRVYGSFTVTPTNALGTATVNAFINTTEGEMRLSQAGNTITVSGRGTGGANGTNSRSNSGTIFIFVTDSKNRNASTRLSAFGSHGIIQ